MLLKYQENSSGFLKSFILIDSLIDKDWYYKEKFDDDQYWVN